MSSARGGAKGSGKRIADISPSRQDCYKNLQEIWKTTSDVKKQLKDFELKLEDVQRSSLIDGTMNDPCSSSGYSDETDLDSVPFLLKTTNELYKHMSATGKRSQHEKDRQESVDRYKNAKYLKENHVEYPKNYYGDDDIQIEHLDRNDFNVTSEANNPSRFPLANRQETVEEIAARVPVSYFLETDRNPDSKSIPGDNRRNGRNRTRVPTTLPRENSFTKNGRQWTNSKPSESSKVVCNKPPRSHSVPGRNKNDVSGSKVTSHPANLYSTSRNGHNHQQQRSQPVSREDRQLQGWKIEQIRQERQKQKESGVQIHRQKEVWHAAPPSETRKPRVSTQSQRMNRIKKELKKRGAALEQIKSSTNQQNGSVKGQEEADVVRRIERLKHLRQRSQRKIGVVHTTGPTAVDAGGERDEEEMESTSSKTTTPPVSEEHEGQTSSSSSHRTSSLSDPSPLGLSGANSAQSYSSRLLENRRRISPPASKAIAQPDASDVNPSSSSTTTASSSTVPPIAADESHNTTATHSRQRPYDPSEIQNYIRKKKLERKKLAQSPPKERRIDKIRHYDQKQIQEVLEMKRDKLKAKQKRLKEEKEKQKLEKLEKYKELLVKQQTRSKIPTTELFLKGPELKKRESPAKEEKNDDMDLKMQHIKQEREKMKRAFLPLFSRTEAQMDSSAERAVQTDTHKSSKEDTEGAKKSKTVETSERRSSGGAEMQTFFQKWSKDVQVPDTERRRIITQRHLAVTESESQTDNIHTSSSSHIDPYNIANTLLRKQMRSISSATEEPRGSTEPPTKRNVEFGGDRVHSFVKSKADSLPQVVHLQHSQFRQDIPFPIAEPETIEHQIPAKVTHYEPVEREGSFTRALPLQTIGLDVSLSAFPPLSPTIQRKNSFTTETDQPQIPVPSAPGISTVVKETVKDVRDTMGPVDISSSSDSTPLLSLSSSFDYYKDDTTSHPVEENIKNAAVNRDHANSETQRVHTRSVGVEPEVSTSDEVSREAECHLMDPVSSTTPTNYAPPLNVHLQHTSESEMEHRLSPTALTKRFTAGLGQLEALESHLRGLASLERLSQAPWSQHETISSSAVANAQIQQDNLERKSSELKLKEREIDQEKERIQEQKKLMIEQERKREETFERLKWEREMEQKLAQHQRTQFELEKTQQELLRIATETRLTQQQIPQVSPLQNDTAAISQIAATTAVAVLSVIQDNKAPTHKPKKTTVSTSSTVSSSRTRQNESVDRSATSTSTSSKSRSSVAETKSKHSEKDQSIARYFGEDAISPITKESQQNNISLGSTGFIADNSKSDLTVTEERKFTSIGSEITEEVGTDIDRTQTEEKSMTEVVESVVSTAKDASAAKSVSEDLAEDSSRAESPSLRSVTSDAETVKSESSSHSKSSRTKLSPRGSARSTHENSVSEVSVTEMEMEGRIKAMKWQLREKRETAAKLKKEYRRRSKELLQTQESSLHRQIKAYDKYIADTSGQLKVLEKSGLRTPATPPLIFSPRLSAPFDDTILGAGGSGSTPSSPRRNLRSPSRSILPSPPPPLVRSRSNSLSESLSISGQRSSNNSKEKSILADESTEGGSGSESGKELQMNLESSEVLEQLSLGSGRKNKKEETFKSSSSSSIHTASNVGKSAASEVPTGTITERTKPSSSVTTMLDSAKPSASFSEVKTDLSPQSSSASGVELNRKRRKTESGAENISSVPSVTHSVPVPSHNNQSSTSVPTEEHDTSPVNETASGLKDIGTSGDKDSARSDKRITPRSDSEIKSTVDEAQKQPETPSSVNTESSLKLGDEAASVFSKTSEKQIQTVSKTPSMVSHEIHTETIADEPEPWSKSSDDAKSHVKTPKLETDSPTPVPNDDIPSRSHSESLQIPSPPKLETETAGSIPAEVATLQKQESETDKIGNSPSSSSSSSQSPSSASKSTTQSGSYNPNKNKSGNSAHASPEKIESSSRSNELVPSDIPEEVEDEEEKAADDKYVLESEIKSPSLNLKLNLGLLGGTDAEKPQLPQKQDDILSPKSTSTVSESPRKTEDDVSSLSSEDDVKGLESSDTSPIESEKPSANLDSVISEIGENLSSTVVRSAVLEIVEKTHEVMDNNRKADAISGNLVRTLSNEAIDEVLDTLKAKQSVAKAEAEIGIERMVSPRSPSSHHSSHSSPRSPMAERFEAVFRKSSKEQKQKESPEKHVSQVSPIEAEESTPSTAFGEWMDDDFGLGQGAKGPVPVLENLHLADTPSGLDTGRKSSRFTTDVFTAVPSTSKEIAALIDVSAATFWKQRRYGEPIESTMVTRDELLTAVPPSLSGRSEIDLELPLNKQSDGAYRQLVFDWCKEVAQEVLTGAPCSTVKADEIELLRHCPWKKIPKLRMPRFGKFIPRSVEELGNVLKKEVFSRLDIDADPIVNQHVPKQVWVGREKMISRKKLDRMEEMLLGEMYAEEPGWVDYDEEEEALKEEFADKIWDQVFDEALDNCIGILTLK